MSNTNLNDFLGKPLIVGNRVLQSTKLGFREGTIWSTRFRRIWSINLSVRIKLEKSIVNSVNYNELIQFDSFLPMEISLNGLDFREARGIALRPGNICAYADGLGHVKLVEVVGLIVKRGYSNTRNTYALIEKLHKELKCGSVKAIRVFEGKKLIFLNPNLQHYNEHKPKS